jgi:hypothetical protein
MAVLMLCRGLATGGGPDGEYLASFDPEAGDGWGEAVFTRDVAKALRFPDFPAAYAFLGTRPTRRPVRPDGKPNRPLTAFTMEFVRVDDAQDREGD